MLIASAFRSLAFRCQQPVVIGITKSHVRWLNSTSRTQLITSAIRKSARTPKKVIKDETKRRVVAFATADAYRLESLEVEMRNVGRYALHNIQDGEDEDSDTLHLSTQQTSNGVDSSRDIFVSRNGTVVFWNATKEEQNHLLSLLKPHQDKPYRGDIVESEMEEVGYANATEGKKKSHLAKDTIWLRCPSSGEDEKSLLLEKYTISNVISISVKLAVWESLLSELVDSIEDIVEHMKEGKIHLSRMETLKKSGELTAFRYNINLGLSGLLDVPDFYWDRESLEPLYARTKHYFSIAQRTQVMNEKLNYCFELMDLVHARLAEKHSARLEWMIIVLICIEVAIELIHYWHEWYFTPSITEVQRPDEEKVVAVR